MFVRIMFESFRRQRRRKLLAAVAIMLGVSLATAMIAVATDIGDKVGAELRTYGANLVVYPDTDALDVEIGGINFKPAADGDFLHESDLPAIQGIFWHNNIVGFAPMLPLEVDVEGQRIPLLGTYFSKELRYGTESFVTGVRKTHPWWRVTGAWPADDSSQVLLGERLAAKLNRRTGQTIRIGGDEVQIAGVLSSGGGEDDSIVAPLKMAQALAGTPGAVQRVYVSAVTKPEDELARRDPSTMNPETFDRWFCSPYANSIAFQLKEALPHSRAEQIRQVAQNEGTALSRIQGLMLLITLAALLGSALAVSATMATTLIERRTEIGLMKALGAGNGLVASVFLAEATLLGLFAGTAGYVVGALLANRVGLWVFDTSVPVQPALFPFVIGLAVVVTFAGSAATIRRAVRHNPVLSLRGDM